MSKYLVILDENTTKEVKDLNECIEVIKEDYRRNDICLGELLNNIEVQGFSVNNVVDMYAQLIKDIENDYLEQGNEEEEQSCKRGLNF